MSIGDYHTEAAQDTLHSGSDLLQWQNLQDSYHQAMRANALAHLEYSPSVFSQSLVPPQVHTSQPYTTEFAENSEVEMHQMWSAAQAYAQQLPNSLQMATLQAASNWSNPMLHPAWQASSYASGGMIQGLSMHHPHPFLPQGGEPHPQQGLSGKDEQLLLDKQFPAAERHSKTKTSAPSRPRQSVHDMIERRKTFIRNWKPPKQNRHRGGKRFPSNCVLEPGCVNKLHPSLASTASEEQEEQETELSPEYILRSAVDEVTTVMVKNIPLLYVPEELLHEFHSAGFEGKFDFFYLPIDFRTKRNRGYGFVNFKSDSYAREFALTFHSKSLSGHSSPKILEVVPAETQGYEANALKFKKRRISNPWFRPMFVDEGGDVWQ